MKEPIAKILWGQTWLPELQLGVEALQLAACPLFTPS